MFEHPICHAVTQNILRLGTNAESMHMFDLFIKQHGKAIMVWIMPNCVYNQRLQYKSMGATYLAPYVDTLWETTLQICAL